MLVLQTANDKDDDDVIIIIVIFRFVVSGTDSVAGEHAKSPAANFIASRFNYDICEH